MLTKTDLHTSCPWKGKASYYTINLDSESSLTSSEHSADGMIETEFKNSAWYYPEPLEKAKNIKDYVAFCEYLRLLFDRYPFEVELASSKILDES